MGFKHHKTQELDLFCCAVVWFRSLSLYRARSILLLLPLLLKVGVSVPSNHSNVVLGVRLKAILYARQTFYKPNYILHLNKVGGHSTIRSHRALS